MTIYYAHPITDYDTVKERRDIALLRRLGFEVYNPNSPEDSEAYREHGMKHFCDIIRSDEIVGVAFRTFHDGMISAGVSKEIQTAYEGCNIVFRLTSKNGPQIVGQDWVAEHTLSVKETRKRIINA